MHNMTYSCIRLSNVHYHIHISISTNELTFTTIPVGTCLSTTQLLVLLVACPPGPDPRTNCSSRSFSWTTGRSIWCFLPAAKIHGHPVTRHGRRSMKLVSVFGDPHCSFQTVRKRWWTKRSEGILQSLPLQPHRRPRLYWSKYKPITRIQVTSPKIA